MAQTKGAAAADAKQEDEEDHESTEYAQMQ